MHKYDEFIRQELASRLGPGEEIEVTGFLFTKSLAGVVASHGLSLIGAGYFFAALTRRRMFTIATVMGAASLKTVNQGVMEFRYSEIQSIESGGFLNQKRVVITLKDGKKYAFRLNTLATSYASGQKRFIESLKEFHPAGMG